MVALLPLLPVAVVLLLFLGAGLGAVFAAVFLPVPAIGILIFGFQRLRFWLFGIPLLLRRAGDLPNEADPGRGQNPATRSPSSST